MPVLFAFSYSRPLGLAAYSVTSQLNALSIFIILTA